VSFSFSEQLHAILCVVFCVGVERKEIEHRQLTEKRKSNIGNNRGKD
jgi:hypothetical protein